MSDEIVVSARRNCCRLCLRPDNECVPIFTSFAADKEPLSTKILACVDIKVKESDEISVQICHYCVSFINSWQSFKNQCIAANVKQEGWLERAKSVIAHLTNQSLGLCGSTNDGSLMCSSSSTSIKTTSLSPLLPVKQEPKFDEDSAFTTETEPNDETEESIKVSVDPLQFLSEDDDEMNDSVPSLPIMLEGPQILTSLGLRHVNSVDTNSVLVKLMNGSLKEDDNPKSQRFAEEITIQAMTIASKASANNLPLEVNGDQAKDATIPSDFLNKRLYQCKICSKIVKLRKDFRAHVYNCHPDLQKKNVPPGSCVFCGIEFDDPLESKLHYNNIECVAIFQCAACDGKFTSHDSFVQHIYEDHASELSVNNNDCYMPGNSRVIDLKNDSEEKNDEENRKSAEKSESKRPHACTVCGQSYNNKNNVLRHMESKHPDQLPATYKCPKCEVGYPRLSMLRNHTIEEHQCKLEKLKQENIVCRLCSACFDAKDKWIEHQTRNHLRYACSQCTYQNKYLDEFLKHLGTHTSIFSKTWLKENSNNKSSGKFSANNCKEYDLPTQYNGENDGDDEGEKEPPRKKRKSDMEYKECMICHNVFTTSLGLSNHMRIHNTQLQHKELSTSSASNTKFKLPLNIDTYADNAIKKVMDSDAKARRLQCNFCPKTFATKDTLRRHLLEMHQIDSERVFKCSLCLVQLSNINFIKKHMETIHGPNTFNMDEIKIEYQCRSCPDSFPSKELLTAHISSMHRDKKPNTAPIPLVAQDKPTFWFQCRYCSSNFDTNKKLAIHLNAHDEYDSKDYSCKDCGNVYSGRKSLWVHRYKKHPMVADPVPCKLCEKIFFDTNMYELHNKWVHQKEEEKFELRPHNNLNEPHNNSVDNAEDKNAEVQMKMEPKTELVTCAQCNEKFYDLELFKKHAEKHEFDFYTNNPLAAILDAGPSPNKFVVVRSEQDTAYICDLCPKSFPNNTALKVHRNWHFRGDSKQVCKSTQKKIKGTSSYKCQYCSSTFVNSSNLRRHIAELHKHVTSSSTGVQLTKVLIEKYLACSTCGITLSTRSAWINHKIDHVRQDSCISSKGWGCEICGRLVSRKHRLLQHMNSHLRESEPYGSTSSPELANAESNGFESISPTSVTDESSSDHQNTENIDEEKMRDAIIVNPAKQNYNDDYESDDSSLDLDFEDDSSSDQQDDDKEPNASSQSHSCDLCHITFYTSKELQLHVASHFLNGPGSVTLTDLPKDHDFDSKETH